MKFSLIVLTHGEMEGKKIQIRWPEFLIGRDPRCHLRSASPLISQRHCALLICNERVVVRDLDTNNGTLINGIPVKGETSLDDGDRLKVGPLEFQAVLEEPEAKATSPLPVAMTPEDEAASLLLEADEDPADRPEPGDEAASLLLLADQDPADRPDVAAQSNGIPAESPAREALNPTDDAEQAQCKEEEKSPEGESEPMSDIRHDDGPHIDYPILLLMDPAVVEEKMSFRGVLKGSNKTRGEFPLLFLDNEQAAQCRETNPALVHYKTVELRTSQEAIAFVDAAERAGCEYFGFYRAGRRARFVSLSEFRKRIAGTG
jgi:predicted component of type VI protein secretion system